MEKKTSTRKPGKANRNEDIITLLSVMKLPETASDQDYAAYQKAISRTTIEDAIAHLTHENELLARKNSASGEKKQTKAQKENEQYKKDIMAWFTAQDTGAKFTATEVMNAALVPAYPDVLWTNQKATGLLTLLADGKKGSGDLNRVMEKGKAYFKLAD